MSFFTTIAKLPTLKSSLAKCLTLLFILFLTTAFLEIFLDTTGDIFSDWEGR